METPPYYKSGIEPIEYIDSNKLNFTEGNIIKYITRYRKKNGKQDLLKAQWYIEHLIKNY